MSFLLFVNLLLILVLIYFMNQNRNLIDNLKKDINLYMQQDMDNLKKVLETVSYNDKKIYDKTNFILGVLEEDEKIEVINKPTDSITLKEVEKEVDLPSKDDAWLSNISSTSTFKKILNTI